MTKSLLTAILALLAALTVAAAALASATPVGTLPHGPVTAVTARQHTIFRVTLPKPAVAGRVWRIARPYRSAVVVGVREGETKATVWLTFRAVGRGKTSLVFAMTRGERSHAYAARTFVVTVR